MKRKYLFGVFCLFVLSFLIIKINKKDSSLKYPLPTTQVKMDMEEGNKGNDRRAWIEQMHFVADGIDWRAIERKNTWNSYLTALELKRNKNISKGDIETFANGNLFGKWTERGSKNQAGSILEVTYDQKNDLIYALSAGGSIFKGPRSGNEWEIVNDKLQFSENYFEFITLPDGENRLLAAINHSPFYSDDLGETWTKASGITTDEGAASKDFHRVTVGDETYIFILVRKDWWSDAKLYYSRDWGKSFRNSKTFRTSDINNISAEHPINSEEYFIIEQTAFDKSTIYKFRFDNQAVVRHKDNSPIGFGEDKGNLQGYKDVDGIHLYAYNGDLMLRRSDDEGESWDDIGTLPFAPWDVRLHMSKYDKNLLHIGGLNSHYSSDGGENWQLVNEWWEYYDNVEEKLHADIMDFEEFESADGTPFLLNSNHGGLNISYDGGFTYSNIGMQNLNVSQYYDVATSPQNPNWVFAGTQDQGLQRTLFTDEEDNNFEQVISGDYGHNTFTDNGNGFWTVYPDGWVTFYPDPYEGYASDSYQPDHNGGAVWIPPLVAHPDKENTIYIVGCSNSAETDSKLIELRAVNGSIQKTNKSFDFSANNHKASAMAISNLNSDLWFVATDQGRFYRSDDGGADFELTFDGLSGANYLYGSDIFTSKIDENIVILSGSGYSNPPVFISYDKGSNFEEMGDGLPHTMVFGIASNEDESMFFAATEAGPYVLMVSERKWYPLSGISAPSQTYWSVEYVEEIKTARFGTYGRGIWDFKVEEMPTSIEETTIQNTSLKIKTNPVQERLIILNQSDLSGQVKYSIYSASGHLIQENTIGLLKNIEIDLDSKINNGNYFIQFQHEEFKQTLQFVKVD